jgi:AcrR family transcriptional regulator
MSGQPHEGELAGPGTPDRPRNHAGTTDAEIAILTATERLLAEVPLHELSVAQIINAAEISRATFYFYFSSKFAVLTALVERAIGEIYAVSRPFLDRSDALPIDVALRQRIQASARIWDAHRPVLQATVENWHVFPELRTVWLKVLDGLTAAIAAEIDRERAAGRAPSGPDSRKLAAVLAWTTERCLYVAGLGVRDFLTGEEETVAALTRLWLGAMYGYRAEGHEVAA